MGPSGHPTTAWMHRLEVVGLQQADTLSLVWDQCHRWQQGLGTAMGHIQGRGPASLPGHTHGYQPVPCVRSPPVPWAGLFFEALQGHGLLLPISRKGQLRPSRNALSAASTSAPQNIFPFRRGSLLAVGSAVPMVVVPTMPLTVSGKAQGIWDGFVGGLGVGGKCWKQVRWREGEAMPDGAPGHGSKSNTPPGTGCPRWVSQQDGHCPLSPGGSSTRPRHGGAGGGLGVSAQPLLFHVPSLL